MRQFYSKGPLLRGDQCQRGNGSLKNPPRIQGSSALRPRLQHCALPRVLCCLCCVQRCCCC
eukprot:4607-Heterococcus_DN1.PRE.2